MYLWSWETYPPDHNEVFEALRRGCGAKNTLIDTPGHVFTSTKLDGTWYDDRPAVDVTEESIAMWIAGFTLQWTWCGVVAVEGCDEFIDLGDEHLRFVSRDKQRLEQAVALSQEVGLKIIDRFPWQ